MGQGSTTTLLFLCGCLSGPGCGADPEVVEERGAPAPAGLSIAPTWTEASPMAQARANSSATRLLDGRVLVAGGNTVAEPQGMQKGAVSGELFDPAAEQASQWTGIENTMAYPHSTHVAVLLDGGDVVIVGAPYDQGGVDLYDWNHGVFKSASFMSHGRVRAAAVPLAGRGALIIGGAGYHPSLGTQVLASAELYDPDLDAWTLAGEEMHARINHTATLLDGGKRVLVIGGSADDGLATLGSAEIFDPEKGDWTLAASMSAVRMQHTATRIELEERETVLVAGGRVPAASPALDTVELYDTEKDVWSPGPPMLAPRSGHTATLLENGAVLVVGGVDELGSSLRTAELFDPVEVRWVVLAELSRTRVNHTATLLADGRVLVAGGDHEAGAEIYRLGDDGSPCQVGRECASGLCVDSVCCGTQCPSQCHSCALPGSEGTCLPAPAGTDPRRECGSGEPCDDACGADGACEGQVGALCSPSACTAGGEHALPSYCAGADTACPAPLVEDCGGFRCDPEAGECAESCVSVGDCAPGFACDLSHRCVRPPDKTGGDTRACGAAPSPEHGSPIEGATALLACVALAARLRAGGRATRRRASRRSST